MKLILIGLLGLVLTLPASAATSLKVGDVLLQPLSCWACSLIEAEEETIFSHVGVVLSLEPLLVGEAFGKVKAVPFEEFNAKTEKGQKLAVLRLRNSLAVSELEQNQKLLFAIYAEDFAGRKYDHDFLWNNFDEAGEEKFYCSEFIAKLFQAFLGIELPIKRMHFNQNREGWITYFRGLPPDGKWGNSPGDLERSELFYFAGEL